MNGILNSSRDAARAWTTCFGIKQSWSMVYMMCTQNKMVNPLQLGPSFAKAGALTSKKCDIFATPTYRTYSGDLTLNVFLKSFFSKLTR